MTGSTTTTLRYRTAQAAVVDLLRTEILSGRLQAGSRLLQADLAERFETSTTPVREALRQLLSEGLLDGDPHRGVTVHETSLAELLELYEIRMVLEPLAIAATVEGITPSEIGRAERLLDQMEANVDPATWTVQNAQFHALLAAAAQRPLLAGIIGHLRNLSALYVAESITRMPERMRAAGREHRQLVDACKRRDVEDAQEVERAHLEHTLELGRVHLGSQAS